MKMEIENVGNSVNRKNRNEYLDALKGFLIFVVIVGHLPVFLYREMAYYRIDFLLAYSFHMFLFMVINGYLVENTGRILDWGWLGQRFCRVMIPYATWIFVVMLYHGNFSVIEYFRLFIEPRYWYLIVLFFIYATQIFVNTIKGAVVVCCFTMAAAFFLKEIEGYTLILKLYAIYVPFYYFGVFYSRYQIKIKKFFEKRKGWISICLLLYPISMLFYTYKDHSRIIVYFNGLLSDWLINQIAVLYNHFFVAPLGIIFWVWVTKLVFMKVEYIRKGFAYLGCHTLAIYVIHEYFIRKYFGIPCIDYICSLLISIASSLVIVKILERNPVVDFMFLGNYRRLLPKDGK